MSYEAQLLQYRANIARQLMALMKRDLKEIHETGYPVWRINCLLIDAFERIDTQLVRA